MKHEWRKHEKEIYLPKTQPVIIDIPEFKYFTIEGEGKSLQILHLGSYDNEPASFRQMEDFAVFFQNPLTSFIATAKDWFGENNVVEVTT